ncbi:MAG: hypothetical protein KF830_08840 [Planctomycetes bacterium]|nr:hypothetical protein [Planctomycetota bacterium]
MNLSKSLLGTMFALSVGSAASAQVILSGTLGTQTLNPALVYELNGEVFVGPGATLTIPAGTVFRSQTVAGVAAALTVARGGMIIANGTRTNPIVFTSKLDTGVFRPSATAEWGTLSICGRGYVNTQRVATNTAVPSGSNRAEMEGLSTAGLRDYGGNQDNDDSGSLSYCQLLYGGFNLALASELNGLSLGGVGRETDIHHIETVNNIDDGIEIWGGTVNLKYVSIWNCGDDSFDLDQGWRGKAQYGLIVQGFTTGASQGSGFGDNSFEIDGAEFCHWQPVTTATIYNFTVVGSPDPANGANGGDHATEWRDNANVQFRNCLFMDTGDQLILNLGTDGEAGNSVGYGCNGTLSWAARWTTPSTTTSTVNPFPGAPELTPAQAYTAQAPGNLIEFRDNLFYRNLRPAAYTEADLRGVRAPFAGNNNHNVTTTTLPIAALTRGPTVSFGGGARVGQRVTFLNPLPVTPEAQLSVEWAPESLGFFDGARFRGAFGEGNNWLTGWTAMGRYGITPEDPANVDLGGCRAGSQGCPIQVTTGTWAANTPVTITVKNLEPLASTCILVAGLAQFNFPIFGGVVVPTPDIILTLSGPFGSGQASASWINPPGGSGTTIYTQALGFDLIQFADPLAEFSFSNAQAHLQP